MSRPKGSRNIKPTSSELKEAAILLKVKAAKGDVNAAGWLLALNQNKEIKNNIKTINGRIIETR